MSHPRRPHSRGMHRDAAFFLPAGRILIRFCEAHDPCRWPRRVQPRGRHQSRPWRRHRRWRRGSRHAVAADHPMRRVQRGHRRRGPSRRGDLVRRSSPAASRRVRPRRWHSVASDRWCRRARIERVQLVEDVLSTVNICLRCSSHTTHTETLFFLEGSLLALPCRRKQTRRGTRGTGRAGLGPVPPDLRRAETERSLPNAGRSASAVCAEKNPAVQALVLVGHIDGHRGARLFVDGALGRRGARAVQHGGGLFMEERGPRGQASARRTESAATNHWHVGTRSLVSALSSGRSHVNSSAPCRLSRGH